MRTESYHNASPKSSRSERRRWTRAEVAEKIEQLESVRERSGWSMRRACKELCVPRSTLQCWMKRQARMDASAEVIAFFESRAGTQVLEQLVRAVQFVITSLCGAGIRQVCRVLELAGLDRFVASSYGTQCEQIGQMERLIGRFGEQQVKQLSQGMRPRGITICQDETFHPDVCLVALEPASGYIMLEKYTAKRDAATWSDHMAGVLDGLPVRMLQSTSDEAKALIKHTEQDQGAHHSPDVFHVMKDLGKGTSGPIASKLNRARKAVHQTEEKLKRMQAQARRQGHAPTTAQNPAQIANKLARAELQLLEERHQQMREAIRGISQCYHPFDLTTGQLRTADTVSNELNEHFAQIDHLADELSLSQKCRAHINKARRVLPRMVQTVTFYHEICSERVQALGMSKDAEQLVYRWISARYVQLVASRASTSASRTKLRQQADELRLSQQQLAELGQHATNLGIDSEQLRWLVEDCAQLFQRSSSAVEGRNSYLDLFHHGHHRLSDRKLTSLTVVHNFFKRRSDGSTAAQRFFEQSHPDLFAYLLEQMPPLPAAVIRIAPPVATG